jgi:alpha-amylase/alpha-mannosidase (GH57 family)
VLARTLDVPASASVTYQPYLWKQGSDSIRVLFRDHKLSDLIGFVYARMGAEEAASHFLTEIRNNCRDLLESGRDALVPIILDGENAWEFYSNNGRPFLRELYSRIAADPVISALTISEALATTPAKETGHLSPGSWVDANFDIWIGAEEDNRAWELLLGAREAYDRAASAGDAVSAAAKQMAWEELMIAEGSDWCWWYGPEHSSANRSEFDQLYRDHLANVYRLLHQDVPRELDDPILQVADQKLHDMPTGLIQPVIDGAVTSQQEWANAGHYRSDFRPGAMHSRRPLLQDLHYGSDGQNIFLRLDLGESLPADATFEFHLRLRNRSSEEFTFDVAIRNGETSIVNTNLPESAFNVALDTIYELRLSMGALRIRRGEPMNVRFSVLRDGLPVAALPQTGEVEVHSSEMVVGAM